MKTKPFPLFLLFFFTLLIVTGCKTQSESAAAVERFYQALTEQNEDKMLQTVCSEWTGGAYLELDALQLVSASLKDFSCKEDEVNGEDAIVSCTGSIQTTYNSENSEIDLSRTRYAAKKVNGEWLMCGYIDDES